MAQSLNTMIDEELVSDKELISLLYEGYLPDETTLLLYLSRNLRTAPRYISPNSYVVTALLAHGATPFLMGQQPRSGNLKDFELLPKGLRSTINLAILNGNRNIIEKLLAFGDRINQYSLSYAGNAEIFQLLFKKGAVATFDDCCLHQSMMALTNSSPMIE